MGAVPTVIFERVLSARGTKEGGPPTPTYPTGRVTIAAGEHVRRATTAGGQVSTSCDPES